LSPRSYVTPPTEPVRNAASITSHRDRGGFISLGNRSANLDLALLQVLDRLPLPTQDILRATILDQRILQSFLPEEIAEHKVSLLLDALVEGAQLRQGFRDRHLTHAFELHE